MDCNIPDNTTSSAGSSSKTKKSKEKKCGMKNKGVMKLSTDPQSVAARERRHRISDRFKILQSMVPGGSKMDTVSMLEEAIQYMKFLKTQIWLHQTMINFVDDESPSPIYLPNQYFPNEHIIPLQQTPLVDSDLQTLPQLPLAPWCCFSKVKTPPLKYWPA